ncbi:DUF541 domain-containing protein [Bacillus sp. HMF5848]|uniref:SIMPL domain-containing protein n=1 Tax=Bacillus sp. HMF5848 TaxID=2495421 RepID=UPI000F769CB2|nr:SIMPL domain-containing protein [Bacillus sp. HMF5848]RSK28331.1 DUF541 domain-containing protein [Bacillus sp. HMF5848]
MQYYRFQSPQNINERKEIRTIQVQGEGTIYAAPNEATIVLGVETENISLQTAQTENAALMNKVLQALQSIGITQEQVQTIDFRINPQYDFEDGKQQFRGYKVTHIVQIRTSQLTRVGHIVDTAVQNGANIVRDVSFSITDSTNLYQYALKKALEQATVKATTIANFYGVPLSNTPTVVKEEYEQGAAPIPRAFAQAEATPIQPGQIGITARVLVEY